MNTSSVDKAVKISMAFEGSRGFSNIGGNFDGQGLSFGALQWNAGQGTLQPLLRESIAAIGPDKAKQIFTNDGLYVLNAKLNDNKAFLDWCCTLTQQVNGKHRIIEPWYTRFYTLALTPECQAVQIRHMAPYINTAKQIAKTYNLQTDRGFALAFDIAIQNGNVNHQAAAEYAAKLKPGMNEKSRLFILANAVANASNHQWVEDVRSRKVCIATGTGLVHKKPYNLDKDYGLTDGPDILGEFA